VRRDNGDQNARNTLIANERSAARLVLYPFVMKSNMNRLETIADRNGRSRVRDLAFAAMIVLAGAVSMMSVGEAVHAANVTHVAQK
jgi:hypothetical protein